MGRLPKYFLLSLKYYNANFKLIILIDTIAPTFFSIFWTSVFVSGFSKSSYTCLNSPLSLSPTTKFFWGSSVRSNRSMNITKSEAKNSTSKRDKTSNTFGLSQSFAQQTNQTNICLSTLPNTATHVIARRKAIWFHWTCSRKEIKGTKFKWMCVWLNVGLSFGRLKADSLQTNINFQSMCFVKRTSILLSVKGWFIRDQHQVWMITLSVYVYVAYISGIHNFLNQWSSREVSINTCAQRRVKRRFQWKESIF